MPRCVESSLPCGLTSARQGSYTRTQRHRRRYRTPSPKPPHVEDYTVHCSPRPPDGLDTHSRLMGGRGQHGSLACCSWPTVRLAGHVMNGRASSGSPPLHRGCRSTCSTTAGSEARAAAAAASVASCCACCRTWMAATRSDVGPKIAAARSNVGLNVADASCGAMIQMQHAPDQR